MITVSLGYQRAVAMTAEGVEVRRRAWPAGQFVRAHRVPEPPPATLPAPPGWAITLREPSTADISATDYERA